jgi:hypothetical protein
MVIQGADRLFEPFRVKQQAEFFKHFPLDRITSGAISDGDLPSWNVMGPPPGQSHRPTGMILGPALDPDN